MRHTTRVAAFDNQPGCGKALQVIGCVLKFHFRRSAMSSRESPGFLSSNKRMLIRRWFATPFICICSLLALNIPLPYHIFLYFLRNIEMCGELEDGEQRCWYAIIQPE